MTVHKLNSSELENDYTLIAVHSNAEPYKLAFEINLKLKTKLIKSPLDVTFKSLDECLETCSSIWEKNGKSISWSLFPLPSKFNDKEI